MCAYELNLYFCICVIFCFATVSNWAAVGMMACYSLGARSKDFGAKWEGLGATWKGVDINWEGLGTSREGNSLDGTWSQLSELRAC